MVVDLFLFFSGCSVVVLLLWSEVWRVRVVGGFDRRAREVDLLLVILESAAGGRNVRWWVGGGHLVTWCRLGAL